MANEIGFLRIAKTGKNEKDPLALSSAVQLYGDQGEEGSLVMEHPRLGMDTRVRLGYKSGLNIPLWISLPLIFGGTSILFSCIAQETARCFHHYKPIVAYSIDIAGSLAGILIFTLHSFSLPPPRVISSHELTTELKYVILVTY